MFDRFGRPAITPARLLAGDDVTRYTRVHGTECARRAMRPCGHARFALLGGPPTPNDCAGTPLPAARLELDSVAAAAISVLASDELMGFAFAVSAR